MPIEEYRRFSWTLKERGDASSRLGQSRERKENRPGLADLKETRRSDVKLERKDIGEAMKKRIREKANENRGSGKAIFLNNSLEEIKSVSEKSLGNALRRISEKPYVIIIDGTANQGTINSIEESGTKILVAKNFTTTDTDIELMSF